MNRTDPTGLQDSFEMNTRRDDLEYLNGEISEQEYRDRQVARGAGGVIGGAIVATVVVARQAAPAIIAAVKKFFSKPEPRISPQKQAGHTPGTPQNANRIKQGKPTSTFKDKAQGERVTQDTHRTGEQVPGRPGVREKEYGEPVGTGPNGGTQSRVRTHEDANGNIHGHPCGPETPCR